MTYSVIHCAINNVKHDRHAPAAGIPTMPTTTPETAETNNRRWFSILGAFCPFSHSRFLVSISPLDFDQTLMSPCHKPARASCAPEKRAREAAEVFTAFPT
jgi:hypothetical protein